MSRTLVPTTLRNAVIERAKNRCEYCQYPQAASFLAFELEHIVSEKHGGPTQTDNLALACPFCNRHKGTDLASIDPVSGELVPFYNPRTQRWTEHFILDGARIVGITPAGRVTVNIFQMNHADRIAERERLVRAGIFTIY